MRVGAVDVGSNALRAVVLEGKEGRARSRVVEDRREPVRLGAEVFGGEGAVSPRTAAEAADAMRSFARLFRRLEVDRTRCVATAAVREARNRRALLSLLHRESGLEVEVVTGAEEARLVTRAVRARFPALDEGRHAILDVGGGSAELVLVVDGAVAGAESFDVGAVRLLELAGKGRPASRFLSLARGVVDGHRGRIQSLLGRAPLRTFNATGGNVEAIAGILGRRIVRRPPVHEVRRVDLETLLAEMASLSPRERMVLWGFKADRADVVLPAGIVYDRFAAAAGAATVHVPHVGLRDAVALDLLLGAGHGDAGARLERERVASALALGRRFRFDEEHALRTAAHALRLFDRLAGKAGLDRADRDVLEMAAVLHDVGVAVSPIGHHKHSAYLIRQSELAGITREEQEVVAQVARYHRRGLPRQSHREYSGLPARDRRRVAVLAGILRIADALDRDRTSPLPGFEVRLRGGRLDLIVPGPGDRLLETWAVDRKKDLLERLIGRRVEVRRA